MLTHTRYNRYLELEQGQGGVVVTTTASVCDSEAGGTGSIPGTGSCDIKIWLQHWGLCIPRESENHVNVGPVSSGT